MTTIIEQPQSIMARVGGSKMTDEPSTSTTQPMPAQSSYSNNNINNRSARMKSFINKSYRAKSGGGSRMKGQQQHTRPSSDECTIDPTPSVTANNKASHKAVDPSANTLPKKNDIRRSVSTSSIITPAIRAANAQKLHAMFAQNDNKASSASRASNNGGYCNRSINTERYSTAPTIYSTRTSSSTVRTSNTRKSSYGTSGSMIHQGLAQAAAAAQGGTRYTASYAPKSKSSRRPSSKENHRFNSSDTALSFHNSDTALLFGEDSIKNEPTACTTAQGRGQGGGGSSRSRRKTIQDMGLSKSMFNQSDTSLLHQPHVVEGGGARRRKSKQDFGLSNSMFNQSDTSLLYANHQDFNSSCYEDGSLSFNQGGGFDFCQPCSSSSTEKRPEATVIQQVQKKKSSQNNVRKSSMNTTKASSSPSSSKPMPSTTKSNQQGGRNNNELSKNHPPPTSPRRHSMPTKTRTPPKKRPDPPSSTIPKRDGTFMIRRTQSSNVIRHSPHPPPAVPSLANKDVSSSMKNSVTSKKVGSAASNTNTMRGQQQRVLQPKKFSSQAHLGNRQEAKSSTSSNNMNHGSSYQVGGALRNTSHYLSFTSSNQASMLLQKLPLNSPLFVKRTNGAWTYATLVGRMTQDERNGGETSVIVNLDSSGKAKKILDQGKWERCVRMVNHRKVFVPSSIASGGSSGLQRKNSAPPSFSTTNVAKSSYGRKNSAPDLLQTAAARSSMSATSKSVSFRCVDNTKNASSSSSYIRRNSAPEPKQLFPSDAKSVSFQRDTASGYAAEDHTRGSKMPGESLRNIVSLGHISSDNGTVSFHGGVTNNGQAAAASPRSTTMTSESTTPSRPSSDSPAKKSGSNKPLPQSPTTVVVNLNAKNCSRRDRMRPMLRKNSAPSLLNLGSLDGSKNKNMMMSSSDDSSVATCLPIGSDFEGGGLVFNSLWSSSLDNGGPPKPPPYATNSTARSVVVDASSLYGGMNLRLRGVDP